MPQIHYCAHICAFRLEKSQTYSDFIIIYCYLKNFWIARHIRVKRRRIKSSSAGLRDGEFEGQCCSRKILQHCCLFIAKLSHNCRAQPWSFRGMDKTSRQGQETPREEGQTSDQKPGVEQESIPGSTSKGTKGAPRPPPLHIISSNADPEWPHSLTAPNLQIQRPGDFTYGASLSCRTHDNYHTVKIGTSLLLYEAPSFRLQWGCTQPNLNTNLTGTSPLLDTFSIIVILSSGTWCDSWGCPVQGQELD